MGICKKHGPGYERYRQDSTEQYCTVCEINALRREVERLRAALQAIINRDPSLPGPKAAVMVSYSTAVAIAKQALAEQAGGE